MVQLQFGVEGGRVVRWCCVNFQCRGVLQFGYSRARAYCARSRCGCGLFGHFYSHLSFLFSFSLSLGDGPIWTEMLSQRAVKRKTTNQPTKFGVCACVVCGLCKACACMHCASVRIFLGHNFYIYAWISK